MHLYDGVYKELFKMLLLGADPDFTAVDLSLKRYLGKAQNGLYGGVNIMFVNTKADSSQSDLALYGGSVGLRNITRLGLTYDIGAIFLYNGDDNKSGALLRANLGWGW
jgi:hypothetical protein